jgi:hypothetical protein
LEFVPEFRSICASCDGERLELERIARADDVVWTTVLVRLEPLELELRALLKPPAKTAARRRRRAVRARN